MFKIILPTALLLISISCIPSKVHDQNGDEKQGDHSTVKRQIVDSHLHVARTGLVTFQNPTTSDIITLIGTPRDKPCFADLIVWSHQNKVSRLAHKSVNLSILDPKDKIYIIGNKENCELTICGDDIVNDLSLYQHSEIVLADSVPGSDMVHLMFIDNHDLGADSNIDVIVQARNPNTGLFTENPLKNKNSFQASDIDHNRLNVKLTGKRDSLIRHHIWVRHEKGVELEIPSIDR